MMSFVPEPRSEVGRFEPLPDDHPSVGDSCVICKYQMLEGEVPTVIALAPADLEEAIKAAQGKPYNTVAAVVHERCAWPGEGR